jgi:hypothetical protein
MWGITLLILSLGLANTHGTQTVQLGWDASQNPTVTGYFLYYGTTSRAYTNRVDTETNAMATVSGLQEGKTYYFAVTAYNSDGVESAYSSEITYITPGFLSMVGGKNSANSNLVSMKFPVAWGHWYEIQASVNLQTWTTIGQTEVATSNAWTQFSDPQASQFSMRFYRLVLH